VNPNIWENGSKVPHIMDLSIKKNNFQFYTQMIYYWEITINTHWVRQLTAILQQEQREKSNYTTENQIVTKWSLYKLSHHSPPFKKLPSHSTKQQTLQTYSDYNGSNYSRFISVINKRCTQPQPTPS